MIDSLLTVTCRSIPAKMYKEKFESGSKGKCILYQLEWLTPNQCEEICSRIQIHKILVLSQVLRSPFVRICKKLRTYSSKLKLF